MQIKINTSPLFQRKLRTSEEKDYAETLMRAKIKASRGRGKTYLLLPSTSLPQSDNVNTGVGNLTDKDGQKFIDFAKKYWGINEIQLLPCGQYHRSTNGSFPLYSSTSMELGTHMIDIKSILPKEDFEKLVKSNSQKEKVNFNNIVSFDSPFESLLRKVHNNIPAYLTNDFEKYKQSNHKRLEPMGIFNALLKQYCTADTRNWEHTDKFLYDDRILPLSEREKRIEEIYKKWGKEIDFYYFKQFLADKGLKEAKQNLNKKGIRLNGDMICGFSYSEKWAHPKAFLDGCENDWGAPVLDFESEEGLHLFKEKVKFNAERYDGIRVDASWTYVSPKYRNIETGEIVRKDFGDKILNIIDEEFRKVKGENYNLKNITHEFTANTNDFEIYSGNKLKPFLENRVKIYTSDYMSEDWGSANAFIKRGWGEDSFVIGNMNHDSAAMEISESQQKVLSDILRIPKEKLAGKKEFIKAKFAEPMRARNNMLFFMPALGINGRFDKLPKPADNYTVKIPSNYEDLYINALNRGEAFNPMDALEKQFIAQGLDKTDKKLFDKIKKYRKILENKDSSLSSPVLKISAGVGLAAVGLLFLYRYLVNNKKNIENYSSSK